MKREDLEKMSEKERMEFISKEIETEQKKWILEGIYPHTFSWVLAKTLFLRKLGEKYNIHWTFVDEEKFRERVMTNIADFIGKRGWINNYTFIKILNKITKLPRALFPRWVYEMDGLKIQQDDGDVEMRAILKDYTYLNIWEAETTKIVKENVKPGMTCIDIGASIGYFTMQFGRLVGPEGKVFSFEPTEMNYDYLCQNIRLNDIEKQCTPFKMAAWDKWEVLPFPRCAAKPFWTNGVPVADFLEKNFGVTKIDFIKIDVDGSEPNVLKGLIPIFEKNPQLKMVIEYYPKYIKDAGLSPEVFMEILDKYFTWETIPDDYTDGCWNYFCKRK